MAEERDADFATLSEEREGGGGGAGGVRKVRAPAAVGVEYMLDGKIESAHISAPGSHGRPGSAVVVTAGALHTPKVRTPCCHRRVKSFDYSNALLPGCTGRCFMEVWLCCAGWLRWVSVCHLCMGETTVQKRETPLALKSALGFITLKSTLGRLCLSGGGMYTALICAQ